MTKVKTMIENLEFDDLVRIKKDLDTGGNHLRKLLKDKIKEKIQEHDICCSVCGEKINQNNVNTFTLIFGPESFKKKATFCAEDCLQYFLNNLKEIKKESSNK